MGNKSWKGFKRKVYSAEGMGKPGPKLHSKRGHEYLVGKLLGQGQYGSCYEAKVTDNTIYDGEEHKEVVLKCASIDGNPFAQSFLERIKEYNDQIDEYYEAESLPDKEKRRKRLDMAHMLTKKTGDAIAPSQVVSKLENLIADDTQALKKLRRTADEQLAGETSCLVIGGEGIVKLLDQGSYADRLAEGGARMSRYIALEKLLPHPFNAGNTYVRVPADIAINTYVNLLHALNKIHDREKMPLIHGDIKPGNVMIRLTQGVSYWEALATNAWQPVFVDMGLALPLDFVMERQNAGSTLQVQGTPYFLAPEVFEGRYGKFTDVYALTMLFYTMLSGKMPWAERLTGLDGRPLQGHARFAELQELIMSEKTERFDKKTLYKYHGGNIPLLEAIEKVLERGLSFNPEDRDGSAILEQAREDFKVILPKSSGLNLVQTVVSPINHERKGTSTYKRLKETTSRWRLKRKNGPSSKS